MFFSIFAFVVLFVLFVYMWMEAHKDTIVEETLQFNNFPTSFNQIKIFFISDIHRRVVSDKIIHHLDGKADLIIIGGDLTEKGVPFSRVEKNIQRLKQLGPVYFVWGNNDYEVDHHELDAMLIDYGVKTLDNTAVTFESDTGEKLILLGVDDIGQKRERFDLALMDADQEGFRILVSHNPLIINKIQPHDRISLVLSGHTHGGQIRFLNLGLYERGKIKKINNTTILISNGYGTTGIPLRLGAPAETHLLTICGNENN